MIHYHQQSYHSMKSRRPNVQIGSISDLEEQKLLAILSVINGKSVETDSDPKHWSKSSESLNNHQVTPKRSIVFRAFLQQQHQDKIFCLLLPVAYISTDCHARETKILKI